MDRALDYNDIKMAKDILNKNNDVKDFSRFKKSLACRELSAYNLTGRMLGTYLLE